MSRAFKPWSGAFVTAAIAVSLAATSIPSSAAPTPASHKKRTGVASTPVVLATGLHSPRDVTVSHDGSVLVAESGTGSGKACPGKPNMPVRCFGLTASIYKVKGKKKGRVVTGLPSQELVPPGGTSGSMYGPNQVEALRNGSYRAVYGLIGLPSTRPELGAGSEPLATLSIVNGKVLGDLAAHEAAHDPDAPLGNTQPDASNPQRYVRDGKDFLVTDAAGNTVIRVHPDGTTETELVIPNNVLPAAPGSDTKATEVEGVPTGIVRGRDGAFYISDLSGARNDLGRVWRYVPGEKPTVFAKGLSNAIDLAVAPNGDLITLSYATGAPGVPSGALTRIDRRTGALTPIKSDTPLNMPTGLAVSPKGDIYVTNNTLTNNGELLKFSAR
ncbi:ScyD/ScyE family protein [Streptomyces sp. NPDC050439]|uniref:ScyD/ScyE family protein n=1 Tax=unclassified Streptomyces TaxID=2593676 RepID=UPI00343D9EA8